MIVWLYLNIINKHRWRFYRVSTYFSSCESDTRVSFSRICCLAISAVQMLVHVSYSTKFYYGCHRLSRDNNRHGRRIVSRTSRKRGSPCLANSRQPRSWKVQQEFAVAAGKKLVTRYRIRGERIRPGIYIIK